MAKANEVVTTRMTKKIWQATSHLKIYYGFTAFDDVVRMLLEEHLEKHPELSVAYPKFKELLE